MTYNFITNAQVHFYRNTLNINQLLLNNFNDYQCSAIYIFYPTFFKCLEFSLLWELLPALVITSNNKLGKRNGIKLSEVKQLSEKALCDSS